MTALVKDRVLAPRRRLMRDVIAAGMASGELRSDLDPDTVLPILVGSMLYLGKWAASPMAERVTVDAVLDVLMVGMAPGDPVPVAAARELTAATTPASGS